MANEDKDLKTVEQKDYVTVKIQHTNPANIDLTFSDAVAIQHTDSEFIITFSQVQQPLFFEESQYEGLETVQAKAVARIVMTPKKMAEFIRAMGENWSVFEERIKKIRERQLKEKEGHDE